MAPRSITLVSSDAGAAVTRRPATQEELEAHWASLVTGTAGEQVTRRSTLMIRMAGQVLEDAKMDQWCAWFRKFVRSQLGMEEPSIKEVNFSGSKLSTKGVQRLFATLKELNSKVSVVKLFQNELQKADDVLDFIVFCRGNLRELHLSHNKLDTIAIRDLIVTAAAATDASGGYLYPRAGSVPLWLRLENNRIDPGELFHLLKASLLQIGRPYEKSICEVDGNTGCNPGSCSRCSNPPPVHITYLKLSEHAKKTGTIPPSVSKAPCLPKAALSKASAPELLAKEISGPSPPALSRKSSDGTPKCAIPKSLAGASPKGWGSTPKSVCVPDQQDKSFSLQDDFPALLGPSPGTSDAAAKAKAPLATPTWGAKSPKALAAAPVPNVQSTPEAEVHRESMAMDAAFPALPSAGKKVRKAAPKQSASGERPQQCHDERPICERMSTLAKTGGSEQDARQLEGVPERSDCQPDVSVVEPVDEKRPETWEDLASDTEVGDHEPEAIEVCKEELTNDTEASEPEAVDIMAHKEESSGWTSWIAFKDYKAEADGYLSVSQGQRILAYNVDSPSEAGASCGWKSYVFASVVGEERLQGWLPLDILSVRYRDEEKACNWLFVPTTEEFCYEAIDHLSVGV